MNYLVPALVAVTIAVPAVAQETAQPASVTVLQTQNAAPAPAPDLVQVAEVQNAVLRAGTEVALIMSEEVTTKKKAAKINQRIRLEVAAPVEVNGVVVIPAGTPVWGELTHVRNKGMWGKSGKLEARLLYMRLNGRQIRMSGSFDDKGVTGTAGVVGAIALVPVAGFFVTGTSAVLPKGGAINGFIDEDVELAFKVEDKAPMQVPVSAPPMTVPVEQETVTEAAE